MPELSPAAPAPREHLTHLRPQHAVLLAAGHVGDLEGRGPREGGNAERTGKTVGPTLGVQAEVVIISAGGLAHNNRTLVVLRGTRLVGFGGVELLVEVLDEDQLLLLQGVVEDSGGGGRGIV